MSSSDDSRRNRACWDAIADDYQRQHGAQLEGEPLAWGAWAIPESELGVLGDLRGREVLELGCGAAQWTAFVTREGARCVGLDQSAVQLDHARTVLGRLDVTAPLVLADAESLPFADESFDVVFCDHGAMSFGDPDALVPEVARVLRAGGLFAFNAMSPLAHACWSEDEGRTVAELQRDWFSLRRFEDEDHVEHQRPTGEWIRLFRRSGFLVEDLIELRPPEGATTSYGDFVSYDWARRWPAETLWRLRRDRREAVEPAPPPAR